jgi:hypothetical protein
MSYYRYYSNTIAYTAMRFVVKSFTDNDIPEYFSEESVRGAIRALIFNGLAARTALAFQPLARFSA